MSSFKGRFLQEIGKFGEVYQHRYWHRRQLRPPINCKRYESATALGADGLRVPLEAYRHPELAQGLDGCGNVAPGVLGSWAAHRRGQRRPAGLIDAIEQDRRQQTVLFAPIRGDEPRPGEKPSFMTA